jgi:hypothetical protein
MADSSGTTIENNKPVGSAGQPYVPIKKEVSDSRANAIKRRLRKKTMKADQSK